MTVRKLPQIEYVQRCFSYKDGHLFWRQRPIEDFSTERNWKIWNKIFADKEAGCVKASHMKNPRWAMQLDKKEILRSLVVWAVLKGEWVKGLDHKNRNSLDDRIENLRPATFQQNRANAGLNSNNTTGFKGVSRNARGHKWCARIRVNNKLRVIGSFETPEEAHKAYLAEAVRHFGVFATSGEVIPGP